MNNYTDNSALMIFIDGLIQDFYVDNKKVDEYVYFFKMDPFSIRNIPITLSNLLLENKKNHNITFVYLNKIQESPKDEFCSSFFIAPLTFSLNINNNAKYSFEEEIDAIYSNISKKDVFLIDKEFNLSITKPHSSIDLMSQDNIELISDKYIRLRIDASDIETNLYKTYIFIDYIPVAVNEDKKYLKWISSPNEIMSTEVMINSPNSGEYCVFTISFPEHYEHKSALESRKFNLSINPHFNIESTNEFE